MKARLCNKDMCNLVDVLRELPETLEGVGIAGIATITVTDDGSISGVLAVSPETAVRLKISDRIYGLTRKMRVLRQTTMEKPQLRKSSVSILLHTHRTERSTN